MANRTLMVQKYNMYNMCRWWSREGFVMKNRSNAMQLDITQYNTSYFKNRISAYLLSSTRYCPLIATTADQILECQSYSKKKSLMRGTYFTSRHREHIVNHCWPITRMYQCLRKKYDYGNPKGTQYIWFNVTCFRITMYLNSFPLFSITRYCVVDEHNKVIIASHVRVNGFDKAPRQVLIMDVLMAEGKRQMSVNTVKVYLVMLQCVWIGRVYIIKIASCQ